MMIKYCKLVKCREVEQKGDDPTTCLSVSNGKVRSVNKPFLKFFS